MDYINRLFSILTMMGTINIAAIAADTPFKFIHYGNFTLKKNKNNHSVARQFSSVHFLQVIISCKTRY